MIGSPGTRPRVYCLDNGTEPHALVESASGVSDFQRRLTDRGVQLRWDERKGW